MSWFANLSLRWKVLFAPALMILALAGVGAFAIVTERANQAAVDGLMTGPVAQAEAWAISASRRGRRRSSFIA
jgi:hypothetical protein